MKKSIILNFKFLIKKSKVMYNLPEFGKFQQVTSSYMTMLNVLNCHKWHKLSNIAIWKKDISEKAKSKQPTP